jgi:hypothetical protein
LGFPIRKSSDQSSVGSSPRLIAAPYVLHRLLVPRHPPCALINLATKMLASTVQFSRYGRFFAVVHRVPVEDGPFGDREDRTLRGNFRSLRTQQRAYVRGRPGIEVPATEWSLY